MLLAQDVPFGMRDAVAFAGYRRNRRSDRSHQEVIKLTLGMIVVIWDGAAAIVQTESNAAI